MLRLRRSPLLAIASCCLLAAAEALAERLPIRAYSSAEGLAHNAVHRIVRDRRGFLWFATDDGLSRFDGHGFVSFSLEQGLPHRTVRDFLETRSGEFWLATFGGLVRFHPERSAANPRAMPAQDAASRMFTVILPSHEGPRARELTALVEGHDGTLWCGTRSGLYRLRRGLGTEDLQAVDIGLPAEPAEARYVNDLLEDRHRSLWVATPSGLYRLSEGGAAAWYTAKDGLPDDYLHALLADRDGDIWVASRYGGFFRLRAAAGAERPDVIERYARGRGLHTDWVSDLWQASDGAMWVATHRGLVVVDRRVGHPARFEIYTRAHGLSHQELTALGEDAGGNLWLGTEASGVMKLVRQGFVTYGEADGVVKVDDVFEDARGELLVRGSALIERPGGDFTGRFGRFDGRGFAWFEPPPPFGPGWVFERVTRRAPDGEWWIAGSLGLYRYPPLPSFERVRAARPSRIYSTTDGLAAPQVYRLFVDSRGAVWASTLGATRGLARWDPGAGRFREVAVPGVPPGAALARSFGEDAEGNVWIGFDEGAARHRHGEWTLFTASHGLPPGAIACIHRDGSRRLWLGSARGGLVRVDGPSADRPAFTVFTTADGLSGNRIDAITDDVHGRVYVATGRGIDQLDPEARRVRHFTRDDGLASGNVIAAFRDRHGRLWFGTHGGLSRLTPSPPTASAPPAVLITRLAVAGEPAALSVLGETDIRLPELPHGGGPLQIDFLALGFAAGDTLRYEYRLEGADEAWSSRGPERAVTYASLPPGRYRFLVRAVNADGVASERPASVAFTVATPLWRRGWFLALSAAAFGLALVVLHRRRIARTLELERLRAGIATELHDDVGANLTRIAILSEVVRRRSRDGGTQEQATLASIASIARESVSAMSDIVWAVNPERDTLQDVVRRMRDHAEGLFEASEVALTLRLPDGRRPIELGANVRRDLYLVFKEAVSNAARHSGCASVSIALDVRESEIVLDVRDDGSGFDVTAETDGNGLGNLRRRAHRLGASLEIGGRPGEGTTVRLVVPVGRRPGSGTLRTRVGDAPAAWE